MEVRGADRKSPTPTACHSSSSAGRRGVSVSAGEAGLTRYKHEIAAMPTGGRRGCGLYPELAGRTAGYSALPGPRGPRHPATDCRQNYMLSTYILVLKG